MDRAFIPVYGRRAQGGVGDPKPKEDFMIRQMQFHWKHFIQIALLVLLAGLVAAPAAADVGRVKAANGAVHIERAGKTVPVSVGTVVQVRDTIVTGADGSVGITFRDDSLMSAGPNTVLTIDSFAFDTTTHAGGFDSTLKRGTLTAVSGKLVKQQPESMRVRTPAAIMGVRGTEFAIRVADSAN
jgi:hypothetical protein